MSSIDLSAYRDIAAIVGVAYLSKYAIRSLLSLWSGFRAYYLAPWGIFRTNLKRHGEWAGELTSQ